MTRRLLLLRHAKAVAPARSDDEADDHARDLAERGRREASALGRAMQREGVQPALGLVSGALRTRHTWNLLAPFFAPEPQLVVSDRLYLAEAAALLEMLRETSDDVGVLMLVGHNPGLHELALHLAGESSEAAGLAQGLPTCTLVSFAVEGGWSDLRPGTAGQVATMRP